MTRLSLVDRLIVDLKGAEYRLKEDMKQLGLSTSDFGVYKKGQTTTRLEGFKDYGLVSHDGIEYYMSTYAPPYVPEHCCDCDYD